jgi:hypothetical protein
MVKNSEQIVENPKELLFLRKQFALEVGGIIEELAWVILESLAFWK